MRILAIGGSGTIGKRLNAALQPKHELTLVGRSSHPIRVDITSAASIENMYRGLPAQDAVVCVAASGALDNFQTLTETELLDNMKGKFFGQANLVLIGQRYLNDGGSFTLTSGIFAERAAKGVTGGGVVSGALHSFVLSAALELQRGLRINVVSPTMAEDSVETFGDQFAGWPVVSMQELTQHYVDCVEGKQTGQIIRAYGRVA